MTSHGMKRQLFWSRIGHGQTSSNLYGIDRSHVLFYQRLGGSLPFFMKNPGYIVLHDIMATLPPNTAHNPADENSSIPLISRMENTGFEPVTSALQGRRSPI